MSHVIPETPPEFDQTRLIERPDGFYWQSKRDGREYGPFRTLLGSRTGHAAQRRIHSRARGDNEEAKAEVGIADWIDPDTGEPSTPREVMQIRVRREGATYNRCATASDSRRDRRKGPL